MALVLPEKSEAAVTSGLHSGCDSTATSGNWARTVWISLHGELLVHLAASAPADQEFAFAGVGREAGRGRGR